MSLVAYNASDDSEGEESDRESVPTDKAWKPGKVNHEEKFQSGQISDEEEYEAVSSISVSTNGLIAATHTRSLQHETSTSSLIDSTSVTCLEDLPAPQSTNKSAIVEEDELEDEVKPKLAEIQNAQKPPSKNRQRVQITIPSLEETPIDEDCNVKEKPVPSSTKSGLFSLLPPPMHSAKKEINRPLIPHTLTKKSPTPSNAKPSQSNTTNNKQQAPKSSQSIPPSSSAKDKKVTLNIAMYGSDSDEDNEVGPSNFFSLDSSSKSISSEDSAKHSSPREPQKPEVSSSQGSKQSISETKINEASDKADTVSVPETTEVEEVAVDPGPEPGLVNDAPLDFGHKSNRGVASWSTFTSYSQGYLGAVGAAGYVTQGYGHPLPASSQFNMANAEVPDDGTQDNVPDDDLKQFMSEKEFQRLSGKRKRGQEQAINFVDANVDDYVDPSELSKHLTEETEYVSHKNKDNAPTAQQRRKKQITYLAYQAKERELELKNTWAQNRLTKKQTQSKYGF